MHRAARVLATPFGALSVVVDDAASGDRPAPAPGAVVASGFRPLSPEDSHLVEPEGHVLLDFVAAAVDDWSRAGDPGALDRVPVWLPGAGFRQRAWQALREVPAGEVVTYRELAALAGNDRASRAAGTACATNPVAPFVPCHRVVSSGGRLGGYGYGLDVKRAMLLHEGVRL